MYKRIGQLLVISLLLPGCKSGEAGVQLGTFNAESERFWNVVSREAVAERIGIDFQFTEGPVWHPDGTLLFSDIPAGTIYSWNGRRFEEFRSPSNGSNGLLVEPDGSVLACEHESRSITRYSPEGELTTLAELYKGRRFNSPNDLCRSSGGVIYFTDPPWGLNGLNEDPDKELPFNGVYMIRNGEVTLLDSTLSWPNGIALSPDEQYLYVANFEGSPVSDPAGWEVFWMRYKLDPEGNVVEGSRFFQALDLSLPGGPDGMKVDKKGNLFATGPGGILVIDSNGAHLGTIGLPVAPANLAFGPGQNTLYVTARDLLIRIRLHERKK